MSGRFGPSSTGYLEGYTTEHLLERLRPPRLPKTLTEPLSDMEVSLVYSAIDGNTDWGGRDLAIVTTFLDIGLHRSEPADLKFNDVHLEEGRLKVMGKGKKKRLLAHLFRHTFAVRFLMNGGNVFSLHQIVGRTSLEMVKRYVNLAEAYVVTEHRRFSPVDALNVRQLRTSSRANNGFASRPSQNFG